MVNKFCLFFISLVFLVTVKSQTCQITLKCDNNGTYTSQNLALTKSLFKKEPQSEIDQLTVGEINEIIRRIKVNKKNIAGNKNIIEQLRSFNKMINRISKSRFEEQSSINYNVDYKIRQLYKCQVDGIPNSQNPDLFLLPDKGIFTFSCNIYYLPSGNATRHCIKGHIYPDFITHPLTCERAQLTWNDSKAHCESFGKVLMEGYETIEERGKFCKKLGIDGSIWEKDVKGKFYDKTSFNCKNGESERNNFPRYGYQKDYFFCRNL